MARGIPPFELLAVTFGIGHLAGRLWLRMTGDRPCAASASCPLSYRLVAVAGLFGSHAFYFLALSLAPAAQASLVAYLWPLLVVLFSALGERLRPARLVGAILGFTGTALLVHTESGDLSSYPHRGAGLIAAALCALIWSGYSVMNRRFREVRSDAMVDVSRIVAAFGLAAHLLFDSNTVIPRGSQWLAVLALGVGPVGMAFLAWDHATKHGEVNLLGSLSYAAPVLSTLQLIMLGYAAPTLTLLGASMLVVAGAWIAAAPRDTERRGLRS